MRFSGSHVAVMLLASLTVSAVALDRNGVGRSTDIGADAQISRLSSSVYTQLAELTESDGQSLDQLGYSVAISGNTIAVGAPYASIGANVHQGAIYVFTKPATGWGNMTQTAKLTASDGIAESNLGFSVSFSGNTIVAQCTGTNGVYIFVQPSGGWADATETAKLSVSFLYYGRFDVAIAGNAVVAGVGGMPGGAAYVFVKPAAGWKSTRQYNAKLTASDSSANDALGYSVSISGNTVVLGAPGCNTNQGAAYVFVKPASGWADTTQVAKLTASDGSQ